MGGDADKAQGYSMSEGAGKPNMLPDIEYVGPDLSLPDDLPYTELEDWTSHWILTLNGIDDEADRLAEALTTERDASLLAAVHASWKFPDLAESLRNLLHDPNDAVRVEAACSLPDKAIRAQRRVCGRHSSNRSERT